MSTNPWVGWSITALAYFFLNKSSSSDSESSDPAELSFTETSIGTPIPAVMGRTILKDPLTIYYGGFSSSIYTEAYAAHANFSAWPVILSELAKYFLEKTTGTAAKPHTHGWSGGNEGGPVGGTTTEEDTPPLPIKEVKAGKYIMLAIQWLLSWLINQRNLRTTIQKGFKYYLGYQQLWAWSGEGARVRALYMNKYDSDTEESDMGAVWSGDESREAHTPNPFTISINDDELFGGADEQGGFIGNYNVYFGGDTQGVDSWMVEQMSQDSVQEELRGLTPAYRPYLMTVVPGAYVGKSATIPTVWIDYQWIPNRLGLGAIGDDANPAEIIYEIYVNEDWGMNQTDEVVNVESLIEMGETLKTEGIGLTVKISTLTDGATVIDSILEHINGVRYQEPTTGKWTYKLIRDDLDATTATLIDETNCSEITYTRLDWQETIGEISVTYTDRNNQYEESSLQDSDPAVIEINGGSKTTKSYNYLYFTSAENALWAAQREEMQQGYPLATASITGNRTLSAERIGEVVRLNFPAYGIKNMFFRVTDVDIGTFIEGKVKLELIEDVFSLEKTTFGYSGSTNWNPDAKTPTGVQNYRFMEMPYELMPEKNSYVFAFANQPDTDTIKWTVWRNSGESFVSTSSMTKWTTTGRLVYDYGEFTDAIDYDGIQIIDFGGLDKLQSSLLSTGLPNVESARQGGKIMIIGDEIMAWSSIEKMANGNYLLKGIIRGIYDTVPQSHGSGDNIFFVESSKIANVTTGGYVCEAGKTVSEIYTITTSSVDESEEFNTLKAVDLTTVRRAERPLPPAKFRMSCFNVTDQKKLTNPYGDITMTWVNRNKDMKYGVASQDDTAEYWTTLDYTLPDGASYLIKAYVGSIKVAEYIPTNNEFIYTWAQRCKDSTDIDSETRLELYTAKDGLESYQAQKRTFLWKYPTMVDACLSENEIKARLANWAVSDRIVIPANDYTVQRQLFYTEMPIFILGTETTADVTGAVLNYAGKYILPNNQIAIVTGKDTYTIATVENGYIFRGLFIAEGQGGDTTYKLGG